MCDAFQLRFDPQNPIWLNFRFRFYLIVVVQANRTPVESTSHSTSHSITSPPSATQPFLAGPSLLVLSHVAPEVDQQPLSAADTVDAARFGTSKLKNWYQASLRCILCWAMSLSLDTNWILMFKFSIRHNLCLFAGTCCHLFHDVKRDSN